MRIVTLAVLLLAVLAAPGQAGATARVDVTIEGGGSVASPDGLISCAPTCSFVSGISRVVELTATPDSRSAFAGWEGCNGAITGNVCTLNAASPPDVCGPGGCVPVTAVYAVRARFVIATRTLSVAVAGAGSGSVVGGAGIDCGQACGTQVLDGTAVTLSAVPAVGSVFAGWGGSCSGVNGCVVNVTGGNHQVTATFVKAPRLVARAHIAGRAVAGGTLRVRLLFDTEGAVGPLRVTCRARVGSKVLKAAARPTLAGTTAACSWKVPRRTRGKLVRGSISLQAGGLRAERAFAVRVR